MFEGLSDKLGTILNSLTRRGSLTEADVNAALREVRTALLEADVALEVVRTFTDRVRTKAIGANLLKSVSPGQMVIKIVNDALVEMLGAEAQTIDLNAPAPVPILMVGLQGSGKTTTTAKIARRLTDVLKKRVLLASLDTRRPAAMEQLAILGKQVGVDTLPIIAAQNAVTISQRAMDEGRRGGYDVVILDTAGRVTLDDELMEEVARVKAATSPHEILLVADALTGQDAVTTARAFDARLGITGIVLTRMDGDSRGGAALSMRAVTGKPIKLVGTGEKVDALEEFHPSRIANRILGMGDIVSLVEKAAASMDQDKALAMAQKMRKGQFDLDDLRGQLAQLEKLGGISSMLGMLPGMGKMKDQLAGANLNDKVITHQRAIIDSMTKEERQNPDLLKASRKKRIAAGSGTNVEQVNKLLKMHRQMADMMKMLGKSGKRGPMAGLANMFGMGGGMGGMMGPGMPAIDPSQLDPKLLEQAQSQLGSAIPEAPPPELFAPQAQISSQTPSLNVSSGASLPGLGAKSGGLSGLVPGLGGLSGLWKKK